LINDKNSQNVGFPWTGQTKEMSQNERNSCKLIKIVDK